MILCIKIEISRNVFYNSLGFYFHYKNTLPKRSINRNNTTIYCYISCFQETYCGNAELLRLLATFRSKSIDKENVKEKKAKMIGESKDKFQPISEDPTMTY